MISRMIQTPLPSLYLYLEKPLKNGIEWLKSIFWTYFFMKILWDIILENYFDSLAPDTYYDQIVYAKFWQLIEFFEWILFFNIMKWK